MSDQNLASAIETLIGGAADTFVVCAGAVAVVGRKTAAEVRTLLSVSTAAQIAAAYQPVGTYATLVGGTIPTAQIPAIAITEYLGSVASQVAMLLLDGDRGDWCNRSDLGTMWVLSADDSTLLASWTQLLYPTSPVTSVAGRTGAITLSTSDVSGLGTLATQSGTFSGTSSGTNTGDQDLSGKQDTLVSATNIKTINSTSLLGSGDIVVSASPAGSSGQMQFNDAGAFGGATAVVYAAATTHVKITGQTSTVIPLTIEMAAAASVHAIQINTSGGSGGNAFYVRYDGRTVSRNAFVVANTAGTEITRISVFSDTTYIDNVSVNGFIFRTNFGNKTPLTLEAGSALSAIFQHAIRIGSLTDAAASNNTVYYSSTASRLVYKDSAGVVNNLY